MSRYNRYLWFKRGGGAYSARELLPIEVVEREINALREKLDESISDSWVSVANELTQRSSTAGDNWFSFRRIPKATAGTILMALRKPAGVEEAKRLIRSILTEQKGVTAYDFRKEALTKGLSYPIKRTDLNEAIIASRNNEIDSVYYARSSQSAVWYRRKPTDATSSGKWGKGELLLRALYRVRHEKSCLSIDVCGVPSTETGRLKPHIRKVILPTMCEWLAMAKSADPQWRSQEHSLSICWRFGKLLIFRE